MLSRDLRLAFRRPSEIAQPLIFFAIVATLFPLAITPEKSQLVVVAPGVVWVAALLASMLALEFLYREDSHDGSLEQFALSGQSLTGLLLAKSIGHWLLTGVPLAIMGPLTAWADGAPASALPGVFVSVAIGSIALSLFGSIGRVAHPRRTPQRRLALGIELAVHRARPHLWGAGHEAGDPGRGLHRERPASRRPRDPRRHACAACRGCGRAHQSGVNDLIMAWTWFHRFGSPPWIYRFAATLTAVVRMGPPLR